MSDFNSLPDEPAPLITDRLFTARGAAAGAERKPTIAAVLALLAGTYQPADSSLTDISALTTTAYGLDFLTLANAAAARAYIGASQIFPWTVPVDVFLDSFANTNWSRWYIAGATAPNTGGTNSEPNMFNNGYLTTLGAQNSEVSYRVLLGAGTWTINIMSYRSTDSGIITISFDGVSVGTIDQYNASDSKNALQSLAGVVVASDGVKVVNLKMATKNGSASSYTGRISGMSFVRTA
jgi:hypothetical protein